MARLNKGYRVDLTDKTFGRLTVVEYHNTRKESYWRCICECGNETIVAHNKLTSGKTTSCGCKQKEVRKYNFNKHIHFIDGTCIEKIASKTTPKNNTSGCKGVYKRQNGSYRASITFKGKRYDLGSYSTFEEAKNARKNGELMVDHFLEVYKMKSNII